MGFCAQGMTPKLVGEGQGVQWKVSKALVPILDLWLSMWYHTGYLCLKACEACPDCRQVQLEGMGGCKLKVQVYHP